MVDGQGQFGWVDDHQLLESIAQGRCGHQMSRRCAAGRWTDDVHPGTLVDRSGILKIAGRISLSALRIEQSSRSGCLPIGQRGQIRLA